MAERLSRVNTKGRHSSGRVSGVISSGVYQTSGGVGFDWIRVFSLSHVYVRI